MSSLRARPVVPAAIELRALYYSKRGVPWFRISFRGDPDTVRRACEYVECGIGIGGRFWVRACTFLAWDATVGQWVFAVALLILFLTSTAYHGLSGEPAKGVARFLDHVAIFVLIAATYTPFALGPLRTHGGILLFALEWLLALIGLCFVLCGGNNSVRISNALYIGMGWLGLFFIADFINTVPLAGIGLILAGGVFYTAGVAFYSAKKLRFSHLVWHLFVLAGAICHGVAVYAYSGSIETTR